MIEPACALKGVLGEARDAFLAALERYTLADLIAPRRKLAALLAPEARPAEPTHRILYGSTSSVCMNGRRRVTTRVFSSIACGREAVRKEDAAIDHWPKELAPSTALRQWFGHKPERWEEFRKGYRAEIAEHPEARRTP